MAKIVNLIKKEILNRLYFQNSTYDLESPVSLDSIDFKTMSKHKVMEGFYYFDGVIPNEFTSQDMDYKIQETESILLHVDDIERIETLKPGMQAQGDSYVEFTPDFKLDS